MIILMIVVLITTILLLILILLLIIIVILILILVMYTDALPSGSGMCDASQLLAAMYHSQTILTAFDFVCSQQRSQPSKYTCSCVLPVS